MPPLGSRSCKLQLFQIARLLYLTARPPTKTDMLLGAAAHQHRCCFTNSITQLKLLQLFHLSLSILFNPLYCGRLVCEIYIFDLIWFDLIWSKDLFIAGRGLRPCVPILTGFSSLVSYNIQTMTNCLACFIVHLYSSEQINYRYTIVLRIKIITKRVIEGEKNSLKLHGWMVTLISNLKKTSLKGVPKSYTKNCSSDKNPN